MRNRIFIVVAVIMLIAGFAACGQSSPELKILTGSEWELKSYGTTGNLNFALPAPDVTIKFDKDEGRFEGSAGCNNYFGGYEIDGNTLTIVPPVGQTEKFCAESGVMEQEQEYLELLVTAKSFEASGGFLLITCADDVVLTFVAQ